MIKYVRILRSFIIVFFKVPVSDSRSTYCNKSWNEFFARTGIRANELWGPDVVRLTAFLSNLNLKCFVMHRPAIEVFFNTNFNLVCFVG